MGQVCASVQRKSNQRVTHGGLRCYAMITPQACRSYSRWPYTADFTVEQCGRTSRGNLLTIQHSAHNCQQGLVGAHIHGQTGSMQLLQHPSQRLISGGSCRARNGCPPAVVATSRGQADTIRLHNSTRVQCQAQSTMSASGQQDQRVSVRLH
jgi:hypothetical protein